jgi:hypothetical protein
MTAKICYPAVHLSIDMQDRFFSLLDEDCGERLPRNVNHFASVPRDRGVPTVWVAFDLADRRNVLQRAGGTRPARPQDKFVTRIHADDRVCFKKTMSALGNPRLRRALREWRTNRVIVTGLFTDACVARTAQDMLATGRLRCDIPLDLVAYNMTMGGKARAAPVPHYAEYNSPEFIEANRQLLSALLTREKTQYVPTLGLSGGILTMFGQPEKPKERPVLERPAFVSVMKPA